MQRLGFEHLQSYRLQMPDHRNYTSVEGKGPRNISNSSAFEDIKAILDPNAGILDWINQGLKTQNHPSRRSPINEDDFWICWGIWLADQLLKSKGASDGVKKDIESVKKQLKERFPNDRFEAVRPHFNLDEPTLRRAAQASFDSLANAINIGNLVVVDETISHSNSKDASRRGMLRYIPGKPHPKGYFCNMILTKLLRTKLPLILDVEFKWSRQSLSMGDAALELTRRIELRYGRGFCLIVDSGYPAASMIGYMFKDHLSTMIVSCSISKVSGVYRHLVETATTIFKIGEKTLLWREKDHLVVWVHKKANYTQVLVTNECLISDSPPFVRPLHKMTFKQAFSLASNFTIGEMQDHFQWPAPLTTEEDPNELYSFDYVSRVTGVDLVSPLDGDLYVSQNSLKILTAPAIESLSEYWNVRKANTKAKNIENILRVHPKAKPAPPPNPAKSKKRKLDSNDATDQLVRSLENDSRILKKKLMSTESRPAFAELYTLNYGLEDRVNAILYYYFNQTSSVGPESRYTWLYFYLCLIDSYVLRTEREAKRDETDEKYPEDQSLWKGFPNFILSLLRDINTQCRHPTKTSKKYVGRDISMIRH